MLVQQGNAAASARFGTRHLQELCTLRGATTSLRLNARFQTAEAEERLCKRADQVARRRNDIRRISDSYIGSLGGKSGSL